MASTQHRDFIRKQGRAAMLRWINGFFDEGTGNGSWGMLEDSDIDKLFCTLWKLADATGICHFSD